MKKRDLACRACLLDPAPGLGGQVLLEGEEQEEQGAEQDGLDGLQRAVHLPPSRVLEDDGEGWQCTIVLRRT